MAGDNDIRHLLHKQHTKNSRMVLFRVQYVALILLTVISPSYWGFGMNPMSDVIQKLTSNNNGKNNNNDNGNKDTAQQRLQELNIQASTTPRLAYARAERIPLLLISSAAPVLRRATGVFPCQYKVQLIERNETIYSYVALDAINKQLSETGHANLPPSLLILYENESDADSKLVREACSMLSLVVTMYPMPVNGPRYRNKINPNDFIDSESPSVSSNDSKFPYFYDPNTSVKLAGSRLIIDYLFTKYGPPGQPVPDRLAAAFGRICYCQ